MIGDAQRTSGHPGADAYEVDDYGRTQIVPRSGTRAWAYLGAMTEPATDDRSATTA